MEPQPEDRTWCTQHQAQAIAHVEAAVQQISQLLDRASGAGLRQAALRALSLLDAAERAIDAMPNEDR